MRPQRSGVYVYCSTSLRLVGWLVPAPREVQGEGSPAGKHSISSQSHTLDELRVELYGECVMTGEGREV